MFEAFSFLTIREAKDGFLITATLPSGFGIPLYAFENADDLRTILRDMATQMWNAARLYGLVVAETPIPDVWLKGWDDAPP